MSDNSVSKMHLEPYNSYGGSTSLYHTESNVSVVCVTPNKKKGEKSEKTKCWENPYKNETDRKMPNDNAEIETTIAFTPK